MNNYIYDQFNQIHGNDLTLLLQNFVIFIEQLYNAIQSILKYKFEESNNFYGDKFYHGIYLGIIDRNGLTVQYISDLNDYRKQALKYILKLNYFIEKQYLYNQQVNRAELRNVKSLIIKRYDYKQVYCIFRQNIKLVENIFNNIHYFKYKQKIVRKNNLELNLYSLGETCVSQLFTFIEIKLKSDFREKVILIRNNFNGRTIRFSPQKKPINFYSSEIVASYDNKYFFVDNQLYSMENLKFITQIYSFNSKFTQDSKSLVTYNNMQIIFYDLNNLRPLHIINYNLPSHSLNFQFYQIVLIQNQVLIFEKNMKRMYSICYDF